MNTGPMVEVRVTIGLAVGVAEGVVLGSTVSESKIAETVCSTCACTVPSRNGVACSFTGFSTGLQAPKSRKNARAAQ